MLILSTFLWRDKLILAMKSTEKRNFESDKKVLFIVEVLSVFITEEVRLYTELHLSNSKDSLLGEKTLRSYRIFPRRQNFSEQLKESSCITI